MIFSIKADVNQNSTQAMVSGCRWTLSSVSSDIHSHDRTINCLSMRFVRPMIADEIATQAVLHNVPTSSILSQQRRAGFLLTAQEIRNAISAELEKESQGCSDIARLLKNLESDADVC